MTSYQKGYNFERRVKKHYEKEGHLVFRQGKSAFPDLIVIGRGRQVFFVECKVRGYMTKAERKMAKHLRRFGIFILVSRKKRKLIFKFI